MFDNTEPLSWGTMARQHNPIHMRPMPAYTATQMPQEDFVDADTLMATYKNGYFQRE